MRQYYDFLVIGTGIAGLSFALKVAEKGTVCVLSKTDIEETNTRYAQGGIASVMYKPDDFKKHISDTMIAGDDVNDPKVVEKIITEAPKFIDQLVEWGVEFDKNKQGEFDLHKEGGHSEHRILHAKDKTGTEIQDKLVRAVKKHSNITILEKHFAVDLITQHHLGEKVTRKRKDIECYGAYILNIKNNKVFTLLSRVTLIATGGIGEIYQTTTNPSIATGDGIAMASRAKATIEGMEFVQFHPTALYNLKDRPSFLITEALRGFGAELKDKNGRRFMQKYDERGSLAPRDIVARAIDNEMKSRGDDYVFLDVSHKPEEEIISHFPNIYKKCKSLGYDITKEKIPVVPAAHYVCGGIKVDMDGCSSIHRLYAAGECSSTGLHGANRLASNSLLEGIVYGNFAARHATKYFKEYDVKSNIPEWDDEGTSLPEEMVLVTQTTRELEQIMSNYVGIVRSNLRLKRALDRLEIIYRETENLYDRSIVSKEICELRNAINVGYLVIKFAQSRKESRGLHYTLDYPNKNEI